MTIKFEDFDPDNILTDEKPYENITKVQLILSLYKLYSKQQMDLLEFMMKQDIQYYLEVKSMIPFTIGLDIL